MTPGGVSGPGRRHAPSGRQHDQRADRSAGRQPRASQRGVGTTGSAPSAIDGTTPRAWTGTPGLLWVPAGAVRIGALPFVCFPARFWSRRSSTGSVCGWWFPSVRLGGAGLFIADGPPWDWGAPVPIAAVFGRSGVRAARGGAGRRRERGLRRASAVSDDRRSMIYPVGVLGSPDGGHPRRDGGWPTRFPRRFARRHSCARAKVDAGAAG